MSITVGTKVTLLTPNNPRLNRQVGKVIELTEWGAHVMVSAAATGRYRALFTEMMEIVDYTGEACITCGGIRLRRAGACMVCEDCGTNSGCG